MATPNLRAQGPPVTGRPCPSPSQEPMLGKHVSLIPLQDSHAESLYSQVCGPENADLWTYMFDTPYIDLPSFKASMETKATSKDPLFFSIGLPSSTDSDVVVAGSSSIPVHSQPAILGHIALMNFNASNRSIELGNIILSPALQRTTGATEMYYLLFTYAFERLGIRRLEWKCNDLNEPSKKAARRLGFSFEGVFRQHMIVKGRNRDTAWFSIVDGEWPRIKHGMEVWLGEDNFDAEGRQKKALSFEES